MRKLGLEDVFAWSEILDKLDIRKEIANIQEDSIGKKDAQTYAGVQIMALLFSKMYKVKKPLLKWIADFTNKSYEEVAKMTIKGIEKCNHWNYAKRRIGRPFFPRSLRQIKFRRFTAQ